MAESNCERLVERVDDLDKRVQTLERKDGQQDKDLSQIREFCEDIKRDVHEFLSGRWKPVLAVMGTVLTATLALGGVFAWHINKPYHPEMGERATRLDGQIELVKQETSHIRENTDKIWQLLADGDNKN